MLRGSLSLAVSKLLQPPLIPWAVGQLWKSISSMGRWVQHPLCPCCIPYPVPRTLFFPLWTALQLVLPTLELPEMGTVSWYLDFGWLLGECLNLKSAPLRPQDDLLLFKMQSRGKVGVHPILPLPLCPPHHSAGPSPLWPQHRRLVPRMWALDLWPGFLSLTPGYPRSSEGTGWYAAGLGGARRTCICRQVLHFILLNSLPCAGPA